MGEKMKKYLLAILFLTSTTIYADAAARFWIGGTGTWDASDTSHWSATTGPGTPGASVPGSGDTVTFDANSGGGTVTVNTTVNITSLTMGAFTGTLTFATNNNNITLQTFSGTGTGTRTLSMGNGTWTVTGTTGTVWDVTTATNFTLNSNSSTILLSATGTGTRNFVGNTALTYNNVTISDTARTGYHVSFAQTTITTLVPTAIACIDV